MFSSTIKRLLICELGGIVFILSVNYNEDETSPKGEIRNLQYILWAVNCNAAIRTDDPSGRTNKLIA